MFKDDFFDEWLDEEVRRVQGKIKAGQALDADDKVLLILKAQVNHFLHLDIDLRGEVKVLREDMDKRFEQVDRRFEQVDKRFEQMREDMDKRFEQMREDMDKRFEQMDRRFEQVDKRFEQMRVDMDKRFEQVDKRFEQTQEDLKRLYQAINTQTWKMIGAIGLIVILARLAGGLHLASN
jgi:DNA anti-recombination protein RmuC